MIVAFRFTQQHSQAWTSSDARRLPTQILALSVIGIISASEARCQELVPSRGALESESVLSAPQYGDSQSTRIRQYNQPAGEQDPRGNDTYYGGALPALPQVPAGASQLSHARGLTYEGLCDQLAGSVHRQGQVACDQLGPAMGRPPAMHPARGAVPCAPPKKTIHHVYIQAPGELCPPSSQPSAAASATAMPQQQPAQALPAGAFAAPPQSGTVVQEQGSLGIRGMRFRLPALTLELPSIEFPSMTRRARGAHMELDSGTAPYVAGASVIPAGMQYSAMQYGAMSQGAQFASYAAQARPAVAQAASVSAPEQPAESPAQVQPEAAPAQAAAVSAPGQPCDSEAALRCEFQRLQQRCERIEHLLDKLISCQQPAYNAMPLPACPPALPPATCPPGQMLPGARIPHSQP